MEFSARVQSGQYDDMLIGADRSLENPILNGMDAIDEAFTPKDLVAEDKGWVGTNTTALFSFDLPSIYKFCHYAYYFRGPVKNVVNNLSMLAGEPTAKFASDRDTREWETLAFEKDFPLRWSRIIRNTFLFNDFFTWVSKDGEVRHIHPYKIEDVITRDGDPEEVLKYKAGEEKTYSPEQTIHHRLDYMGNDKRGVPFFAAVLRELVYYYKWLEDLYYLGHLRARIPVVRKVMGGGPKVAAEANRFAYLPGPGRYAVENYGGEWQFPTTYAGIGDAKIGWETFITSIASAMNLPYFIVSQDYRNNSLASTLSADSPTVRLIRWYRTQFANQFTKIVWLVMGRTVDVTFKWPPVVERDVEKVAKAWEILVRNGAGSSEGMYNAVVGEDWETEKKRIDKEREEEDDRGGLGIRQTGLAVQPGGNGDGQRTAELGRADI